MPTTKWCLKCKIELAGTDNSLSFLGVGSPSGYYCKNAKCMRYGLTTVIFLEEQKKAPEDLKSNNPVEEDK